MNLIKPCKCGDIGRPYVYADGIARQELAGPDGKSELYFTTFSGYVVECENCGKATEHFQSPDEAIDAGNRGECKKPNFEELIDRIQTVLDWYKEQYKKIKGR